MTTIDLQNKIADFVTDRFSDYYEFPTFADHFPHIDDESGDVLGVIVPDDFCAFRNLGDLPVECKPFKTTFVDEWGVPYELTDVYIVSRNPID